jgi:hypothetical protein
LKWARSPGAGVGLGHEGREQPGLLRHLLDHQAEEAHRVGYLQRRPVLEVELVLAVTTSASKENTSKPVAFMAHHQ